MKRKESPEKNEIPNHKRNPNFKFLSGQKEKELKSSTCSFSHNVNKVSLAKLLASVIL